MLGGGGGLCSTRAHQCQKQTNTLNRSLHGKVTLLTDEQVFTVAFLQRADWCGWRWREKQEKGNGGVSEGHVDRKRERAGRKSDVVGDGWWQACYYYSIITSGSVEQWCTVSSLLCHFPFSVRPNPHAHTHTQLRSLGHLSFTAPAVVS